MLLFVLVKFMYKINLYSYDNDILVWDLYIDILVDLLMQF